MYILKNAFINITRNKGRNILIGVIILVIACAATVTLAINNTAKDLINSYKSAYDKELTISFDRQNMMKDVDFSDKENMESMREKFKNVATYTVEDIKNYADSKYIESYYYTYNMSLNGKTIEKATSDSSDNKMTNMPGMPSMPSKGSEYDFTLNGYSSVEAMSEFIEGKYEMTQITDDAWDKAFTGNYVFINEELAELNNIGLYSKFELQDEDGNSYEFEVIGIYKENEEGDSSPISMFTNSANTMITNADALINIKNSNDNIKGELEPTFIIDDYKNADKIEEEFYNKGLAENYTVKTNEEEATAGLSSIKNVKSFATTFLIITLVIGGIVLFVINMINIRERKYEIGVLRTIGMSKVKLTLQFLSELLIVGLVALLLGAGIGAVSSKPISNSLLSSEIESSTSSREEMKNNFGGPGGGNFPGGGPGGFDKISKGKPVVQAYDSIDAVVSPVVLVELLGIGLTLILVSSIASMISIQRFSPLTILKERS